MVVGRLTNKECPISLSLMEHCEDCGTKMYGGFCPNCDEEHFIADQYRELGESVPQNIADSEGEQIQRRRSSNDHAI